MKVLNEIRDEKQLGQCLPYKSSKRSTIVNTFFVVVLFLESLLGETSCTIV